MSKKKHEVTENEIQAFNWTRESMAGKEMSISELRHKLESLNYSSHPTFIRAISSGVNPPIIRVSRGRYVFNPKPVYIDRLKKVWADYVTNKRPENEDKKVDGISIEKAIAILKTNGYKILKPITEYKEV